jgi:hypothetical protein
LPSHRSINNYFNRKFVQGGRRNHEIRTDAARAPGDGSTVVPRFARRVVRMKLVTFRHEGTQKIGVFDGTDIANVSNQPGVPASLRELLDRGPDGLIWMRQAAAASPRVALANVQLCAPIPAPQKFLGLGGNYASHLAEAAKIGLVRSPGQVWFNKQVSCITGP